MSNSKNAPEETKAKGSCHGACNCGACSCDCTKTGCRCQQASCPCDCRAATAGR
jgi:hypothetical protein